jgi:hypothetical protein
VKPKRPSHPACNVRDDRDTPLLWKQDAQSGATDLPDGASEIFARKGGHGSKRFEGSSEFNFYAPFRMGRTPPSGWPARASP